MAIRPLHPQFASLIVVDDSPDDQTILQRAARTFGIKRRHFFPTAEQALQFLRKNPVDFALVDYHLPGMSGLRLVEEMQADFPSVDVIFVTGVRDERLYADAIKLGAKEYLCKDEFVTGGIIRALQTLLRQRLAAGEAGLREVVAAHDDALSVASVEAKWLIEDLSRHYQYDSARASVGQEDELRDIVAAFSSYMEAAFQTFPEVPDREGGQLLAAIVERGLSPRQVTLVYGLALRWLIADVAEGREQPPFTPSLCLIQVLAQMVEHYQSQLTVSQLGLPTNAATVAPRAA